MIKLRIILMLNLWLLYFLKNTNRFYMLYLHTAEISKQMLNQFEFLYVYLICTHRGKNLT